MIEKNNDDKNSLVRSGIVGSFLKFSKHKEVLIYPFLDYLYLYFQSSGEDDPLVFTLWEGDECIFSSFNDLYYTKKYKLIYTNKDEIFYKFPDSELRLCVHKINSQQLKKYEKDAKGHLSEESLQVNLLPVDKERINSLKAVFEYRDLKSFFESALNDLLKVIKSKKKDLYMSNLSNNYEEQVDEDLDIEFVNRCTDSLRVVLDECWQDIQDLLSNSSQNRNQQKYKPELGNIFCVIRMAFYENLRYGVFPYTAKILLSKTQVNTLKDWMKSKCNKCRKKCEVGKGGKIIDVLETPLSKNARSIADLVFCSGIVEFGHEPSDEVWDTYKSNSEIDDSEVDKNRQKVEKCIYPSGHIYYVPIHIGGHPWLSLFTFSSGQDKWMHNYIFYRDIVPVVATKLRLKALDQYVLQIVNIFIDKLKEPSKLVSKFEEEVNKELKRLARIYPFPLIQIGENKEAKKINILYYRNLPITAKENTFFGKPQVNYGAIEKRIFLDRVVDYINKEVRHVLEMHNLSVSRHSAIFSHAMPTHINKIKGYIGIENYKEALKGLEFLDNFCKLAMAAINSEKRNQLRFSYEKLESFRSLIKEIVKEVLDESKISWNIDKDKSGNVRYIEEYLRNVIYEVILNAKNHSIKNRKIEVSLFLKKDDKVGDNYKVFLKVSNCSKFDYEKTKSIIKAILDGTDDYLGTEFLKLCARACNYDQPKWLCEKNDNDEYTKVIVEIQIAEMEGIK